MCTNLFHRHNLANKNGGGGQIDHGYKELKISLAHAVKRRFFILPVFTPPE